MYNPKIYEELIPELYKEAHQQGITMTKLINSILTAALLQKGRVYDDRFQIWSVGDSSN